MLSPNALRVLDSINVYQRIRDKGYNFEVLTFKTDHDHQTTDTYYFGHENLYGYKALRVYRKVLLAELRELVRERGIPIHYNRTFSRVVSETDHNVTFAFTDGTTETTGLLVGADGIHSQVRKYYLPSIIPVYSGFLGVTYAFPSSKLRFPESDEYPLPASIHGKNGAYVIAPQNADGSEIFAGRQFKYPMKDRSGWTALLKDKTELCDMLQSDMTGWSDLVRSGLEQVSSNTESLNIWPFHTVPKLDSWASEKGRVVSIGDAAHAIPPTAGQGANQALEDSYSFAYLLKSLSPELDLDKGLKVWQAYRQERIDGVLDLTAQMTVKRMSEPEPVTVAEVKIGEDDSSKAEELRWLYGVRIEDQMAKALSMAS
jgi:2-polyprenyl-6-methoxyphenol hydroxylase-like FAD-dependent oxidoreductase